VTLLQIAVVLLVVGLFPLGSMAVNDSPVADSQSVTTDEDTARDITLTATDVNGDALTYAVVINPAHGSLTGVAPALTYTPDANYNGADFFTFQVSDGSLESPPATVSITVNAVNDAPVVVSLRSRVMKRKNIAAVTAPVRSMSTSMTATVMENDVNAPPELSPIGDLTVEEGWGLDFGIYAYDPNGDIITYTASPLPDNAILDPVSGEFIWWPTYDQAGTYQVTFTASDGSLTDEEAITITVTDVNPPPELLPIGDLTVEEGSGLDFAIWAYDPDGDTITYSASPLPDGATFDPALGYFLWWPTYDQAGIYPLTFTASDESLADEEAITITVTDVNPPPELMPIGDQVVEEGSWLDFGIWAYDPNGDTITYSAGPLPEGATFDSVSGEFFWGPTTGQAGIYPVTCIASDGSNTDEETITITVKANPILGTFIAGGGYLIMSHSAGQYAGTSDTKNFFGFMVKYNKKGKPQLSRINIIFRSNGHVYRIRSTTIDSLSVDPKAGTAIITSRANFQDITKPRKPISIDRNAALQLTMTDKGKPGSNDSIGITVSNKAGGLLFASKWDGTKTVEQLLGGGNLIVH
jgi:PKD repeat protein